VSASARVHATRNQLAARPYDISAGEFVRFSVDTNDDVVAGVVRSVIAEGSEGCDIFRHGLGEEETATLCLFSMRRTLHGRRQSSPGLIYEALDGFALLPRVQDVPWDSWLKAALFVARSLGADFDLIARRYADVASPYAVDRLGVATEAMNRIDDLSQCHIVEVSTSHGVGFIETLVFRDNGARGLLGGLYGAPQMSDHQLEFSPTTNLAQLAVNLADALDASRKVVANPISQDQLAATSFSLTTSGSYLPTAGCLSFTADTVDSGPSFTAFVAELPADADVESLARAAADTHDQAAFFDGLRLIVLSPQPSFDEGVDVSVDFRDYEDLANAALKDPATL
jgi:hypothetical protein